MILTILKGLLVRHFASEGFKKRFSHIYLPMLKKGLAYFWNVFADKKERKMFDKSYKMLDSVIPNDSQILASSPMGAMIPLYENIADRLKVWFVDSPYQGSTGQCVAFSMDNIVRAVAKVSGLGDIGVSPLDAYLDRTTRSFKGDYTGMNVELMLRSVAQKGIALADLLPRMDNQSLMVNVDERALYPDALIAPFRIKILKGATFLGGDWKVVINSINSLPMGFPVQISLTVGDGYFGNDIPLAKNNTIYGGHSVVAIGGSGCIVDGKEGFFITDSAYYKGRVSRFGQTIRFITKEFWLVAGWSATLPVFVDELQKKAMATKPLTYIALVLNKIQQGESGDSVRTMQNALIGLGYNIPSGATGFYGNETARAVLAFQIANLELFQEIDAFLTVAKLTSLAGKYFGGMSVKVINTLISNK